MRTFGDPFFLEQQRFNAARMYEQGHEPRAIAAALNVDDQTVRRWLRAYRQGGREALKAKVHSGPVPRMTDEQKDQFITLIGQSPSTYKLGGGLWTAAKMAALIKERFGVSYHPSHVGQMMHDLDYSPQMPHKRPRERDQAKIDLWRETHWPEIVERAREQQACIAFVDEAGFMMDPLRKRMWAPRGQTPIIEHRTRNHKKVSVIGGIVASPFSTEVDLLTQWHVDANVDQHGVISFLEMLLKERSGRVIVVWDNLAAHRSLLVKEFVKANPRLWLENLPGYAPELNPIESVWCMSKYHRMANHTIAEVEQLHEAALKAVDEVRREERLLRSCIRHAGLADALYPHGDQQSNLVPFCGSSALSDSCQQAKPATSSR
jgi:transposase